MTRLSGEFDTDLAPSVALETCAQAIDGLGWRIETVEERRIVAYPRSSPEAAAPRIEVTLHGSGGATDLVIVGADSDAHPLRSDQLVLALDRLRDAIAASVEGAEQPEEATKRASLFSSVPLFAERPPAVQLITAVVGPVLFGAVAGVVLGISAALYWIVGLLALIGALLAGLEHPDGRQGALRGLVGGTLYGISLLIAHAVAGTDATVKLPSFAPTLIVFTAVIGVLASGLGGLLRNRR